RHAGRGKPAAHQAVERIGDADGIPLPAQLARRRSPDVGQQHDPAPCDRRLPAATAAPDASGHRERYRANLTASESPNRGDCPKGHKMTMILAFPGRSPCAGGPARLRRAAALLVGLVGALSNSSGSSAQPYPDRPIRMIVPFAAGGTVD